MRHTTLTGVWDAFVFGAGAIERLAENRKILGSADSGCHFVHEGRRMHASPEELTCAKVTIHESGFETRFGLAG
jgi:hypothetical protein